jgi:hypothetical protein
MHDLFPTPSFHLASLRQFIRGFDIHGSTSGQGLQRGKRQLAAQGDRRALIKQDFHVARSSCFEAALGILQNGLYLGTLDAGEPVEKLLNRSAAFKILKECFDGHAAVLEQPGTADFTSDTFNGRTL